jgi:hypothetical protein
VSNHGGLGLWKYCETRKPKALAKELEKFHRLAREAMAEDPDA